MKTGTPANNRVGNNSNNRVLQWLLISGIAIITFLCYSHSLRNDFVNWDDDRFVTENDYIKSLSADNLKMIFFHDVKVDNYVPLTQLSYAINYYFSGLNPEPYILTNIIIHILNCCLMFFIVLLLLNAMEKKGYGTFRWKEYMAFACTLAFAIHPMHVESVCWVSERKDVLYTLFYFAGLIAYLKYITKGEGRMVKNKVSKDKIILPVGPYLLVLIFFLLSILSKPMAIVFPFSLLAIDVLLKRDTVYSIKKIILEKVPYILLTTVFATITYATQKASGTIYVQAKFGFFQRILFASYNFCIYVFKAFIPMPQSMYYPFPKYPSPQEHLPVAFYVSFLVALAIIIVPLYVVYKFSSKRNSTNWGGGRNNFKMILFGISFYLFNMIMVSQLIGAGLTLTAERYSYVCYFGIYFPVTYFAYKISLGNEWIKKIVITCTTLYIIFLCVICYQRTLVWRTSETLWTDVIKKYPHKIADVYFFLGHYYLSIGNETKAYYNYFEAIDLKVSNPRAYWGMGLIMYHRKQYDTAIYCYTEAIRESANFTDAYMDRGLTYFKMGKYNEAMADYKHTERLSPNSENLMNNIAFAYFTTKQFDSCIYYYSRAIKINNANSIYFHYRGEAELNKGEFEPACADFMKNIQLSPKDSECMYYLSATYMQLGKFSNAYKYAGMALTNHFPVPEEYLKSLKEHADTNKKE